MDRQSEDYRSVPQKNLISAILLRLLRPDDQHQTGIQARRHGGHPAGAPIFIPNMRSLVCSTNSAGVHRLCWHPLQIGPQHLFVEYETISESDAAFMGFQQTNAGGVSLANGEMALVVDCGKGTTDISILLADDK